MSAQPHYKLSQLSYNMLDIVNIFIPRIESSSLTCTRNVEDPKVLHPQTRFGGYCR